MAVKDVDAFFTKALKDEALKGKIKALAQKRQEQEKALASDLVKLGLKAGFKFTAEDYVEARKLKAGELAKFEPDELEWWF